MFAVPYRGTFGGDDRGGQFFGFGKGERQSEPRLRARGLFHLFEHFHARLGLFGLGCLGLETIDEGLQVVARCILFLGRSSLYGALFCALAGELVVGACVVDQPFSLRGAGSRRPSGSTVRGRG